MKKLILLCLLGLSTVNAQTTNNDLAIAIVYDTSGSMNGQAKDAGENTIPKYKIANAALKSIIDKIDAYASTHSVYATLITFHGTPVPLSSWNKKAFNTWLTAFKTPANGTPLGEAIEAADKSLQTVKAKEKHIVVLTDGESNGNLAPEKAITQMKANTNPPKLYIVAFDVNSAHFDNIKQSALILPATGQNLETGLNNLFGTKILLENED